MTRKTKNKKPTASRKPSGVTIIKNVPVDDNGKLIISKDKSSKQSNTTGNAAIDMRLAKIRNRYMINSGNPMGEHTYAVYTDNETKEVRAVETTHLYIPDKSNMEKLRKGLLRKVKFNGYETPSGVHNAYYNTNINGEPIDLSHADIRIDKTPIPQSQAIDIKTFAKNKRKR